MKSFISTLLFIAIACSILIAQTTTSVENPVAAPLTNLYGAGVSYNQSGTPGIAGSALYAHLVNDGSGTYAFSVIDLLPNNSKPFTVSTNIGAGIAQKVVTIANVPIFVPTAAGIGITGSNTGWSWSTGALAVIPVKNHPNWKIMPNVRVVKSSVSGGTAYQPIVGMQFGWGK